MNAVTWMRKLSSYVRVMPKIEKKKFVLRFCLLLSFVSSKNEPGKCEYNTHDCRRVACE